MKSRQENKYILVGYHYARNFILDHSVESGTAASLKDAKEHIHNYFNKVGIAPDVWGMNN